MEIFFIADHAKNRWFLKVFLETGNTIDDSYTFRKFVCFLKSLEQKTENHMKSHKISFQNRRFSHTSQISHKNHP